ncbi:MAG: DNA cytosine methyltransferase [Cupriavidus sp.]|nr:DNA cytosine methyltransferase [Cupriavidus sp.]
MKLAYYNEIDPYAAEWLRRLILFGLIAPGDVDERDIRDVHPDDLRGYRQCHFFAGIGVWSHALRRAGWDDHHEVWTGSCPCQPFSAAGKGSGFADERHLWPHFHHLVRERRPSVVLGEQVASKDGLAWLDLVSVDMEAEGYAFAAADICAAGVGAPHIRQRLYWVADANDAGPQGRGFGRDGAGERASRSGGVAGGLADADQQQFYRGGNAGAAGRGEPANDGGAGGLADAEAHRPADGPQVARSRRQVHAAGPAQFGTGDYRADGERPRPTDGFWRDADWLLCRDNKWRPVEPGTFPLAHGAAARVGRLRAYGNAIVAPLATEFVAAVMECRPS